MTPIVRLSEAEARRLLGKKKEGKVVPMDQRTFRKYAQKLGFIEYPGLGGKICYDEADIIKKWNSTKEEVENPKEKKKRGKIKV